MVNIMAKLPERLGGACLCLLLTRNTLCFRPNVLHVLIKTVLGNSSGEYCSFCLRLQVDITYIIDVAQLKAGSDIMSSDEH